MEELLPVVSNSKNGLMSKSGFINRGQLNKGFDLDEVINDGTYSLNGPYLNSPNKSGIYGTLIIYDAYTGGLFQQIVDHGTETIYYRVKTSTGFRPWRKFSYT